MMKNPTFKDVRHTSQKRSQLILSFEKEEESLKRQIILHDCIDINAYASKYSSQLLVGGLDISYLNVGKEHACASLVVMHYDSLQIVSEIVRYVCVKEPYHSSYLALRELPIYMKLYQDHCRQFPDLRPHIMLVDGNGILHPRGIGIACHFGILNKLPTIGVAKSFLNVDGWTKERVKVERRRSMHYNGMEQLLLKGQSGKIWGAAIWQKRILQNPMYVSIGHSVSLDTCVQIVQACSKFRIPEPIRQADLRSRQEIRKWSAKNEVDTELYRKWRA